MDHLLSTGRVGRTSIRRPRTLPLLLLGMVLSLAFGIAPAGAGRPERPIKGPLEGNSVSTPAFVDPARVAQFCDPGATALVESNATGKLSHLGLTTTSVFRHCATDLQPPVATDDRLIVLDVADGFVTFIAANGDQLSGSYSGTVALFFDDQSFKGITELTIGGGTGRFSDAAGELDMIVLITPTGAPDLVDIEVELTGPISY